MQLGFRRGLGALTVAVAVCAATDPIEAAQTSGTLSVTARIGGVCRFSPPATTSFTLAFGTYAPGAGNRDATTTFRVQCSSGIAYQVALDGGGSGNVASRWMAATGAPAETLAYQLYTGAAYTTVWGDGTGGTAVQGGIATPPPVTFTIYGRIPDSGTNLNAAARADYRDTVAILIDY